MPKTLTEIAADIALAQATQRPMSGQELEEIIKKAFHALKEVRTIEESEIKSPLPGKEAAAPAPKKIQPPEAAEELSQPAAELIRKPVMDPMDSIQQDKVICLECGKEFKQISHTHLKKFHQLTPKQYRNKHGLPAGQPLTAKSLSERRRKTAKETGLGEKLKQAREAKE